MPCSRKMAAQLPTHRSLGGGKWRKVQVVPCQISFSSAGNSTKTTAKEMNPTNCCGEEVCWEFKAQAVDSNLLLWGSIFSAGQTWAVADLNFPAENQQQSLCFLSQGDEGWVSICEELRRVTDMSRTQGYKWMSALFMRKSAVPIPSQGRGSCCQAHRCFN